MPFLRDPHLVAEWCVIIVTVIRTGTAIKYYVVDEVDAVELHGDAARLLGGRANEPEEKVRHTRPFPLLLWYNVQ